MSLADRVTRHPDKIHKNLLTVHKIHKELHLLLGVHVRICTIFTKTNYSIFDEKI